MENVKRDELVGQAIAWNHSLGAIDSFVLKCAVETGIPEVIHGHGRPITLSQLGASLPTPCTNLDVLRRIMRYLVHMQLFTVQNEGSDEREESYGSTSATKFILINEEKSIVPLFKLQMHEKCLAAWHTLGSCMQGKAGMSAFERMHGESLWAYASKHPDLNGIFNNAMAGGARSVVPAMIDGYGEVFQGLTSLVDIGGGIGTNLQSIAKAFPHIKCTVLDLPHVVETAPSCPEVEFVAGNMFSFIPKADAVMLMWVLHNWGDEDCVKILKRCKDAIDAKSGKVIVVDIIIGVDDLQELEHVRLATDMIMLAKTGGKERNEKEWRRLLSDAGFNQCKITPIKALQSVIEARP
ncbi:(RS)-norcoclaurine 6-O-methyltransferase-like [Magnolia sinica]|uniref:(RS)-norcoclaurine 6-O-methyltransferase-like n=1 Tax=Magnolia sinica TaxID=86752 RepID=UPI00265960AF|nr:(RS)-norcoclaurine 6-O-methyltransferase-like [Magnolia sinica]